MFDFIKSLFIIFSQGCLVPHSLFPPKSVIPIPIKNDYFFYVRPSIAKKVSDNGYCSLGHHIDVDEKTFTELCELEDNIDETPLINKLKGLNG